MIKVLLHRVIMRQIDTIEELVSLLKRKNCCRIGIDGVNGVGKSTLVCQLSDVLIVTHFCLDDYLDKRKG